jgi:RluA family pseudouridine synthase
LKQEILDEMIVADEWLTMKEFTEVIIETHQAGERLDRFLAAAFPYKSRSRWQNEIESGRVLLNGAATVLSGKILRTGDVLHNTAERVEPEVDRNISILYEDELLVALNKPANLPVHPAGIFSKNTLVEIMKERLGMYLHPLHRLDRDTSGVILLGKDKNFSAAIHASFGEIRKTYIAVVRGIPSKPHFSCGLPLGPARNSLIAKKREAYPEAEESASTRFDLIKTIGEFSLLRAHPETGRQHQIRVHLLALGYPIAGDKLYGADEELYLEFSRVGFTEKFAQVLDYSRCLLHSRSIRFFHPGKNKTMIIKAPLPDDILSFIKNKGRV